MHFQPPTLHRIWEAADSTRGFIASVRRLWKRLNLRDGIKRLGFLWRFLSRTIAMALAVLKWIAVPLWGPVWLVLYLWKVLTAFLLGRCTAETAQRRINASKLRRELALQRQPVRPRLAAWFGLAFLFYLLRRMIAGMGAVLFLPLRAVRFVVNRLVDAKAYVDEQRAHTRWEKEHRKQLARQEAEEAIRRAEKERRAEIDARERRAEANRILESLRQF